MPEPETTVQYVYHSNRLDGISLSEGQTRQVVTGLADGSGSETLRAPDGKEYELHVVTGHARALAEVEELARGGQPIEEGTIKGLHRTLMEELLLSAGEYRECSLRYKGLLIASPPEELGQRMAWFVDLVNRGLQKGDQDAHKLSWRVHHEFITLHPFIEANGRLARLLLNLVRLRLGADLTIVPFEHRDRYSRAIIDFQQQKIQRAQERLQGRP